MSSIDALPARFHLHDAERQVLTRLIEEHPLTSCVKLAAEFEVRTGRRIAWQSVRSAIVRGGYASEPANGHLSDAHREVLAGLVEEADVGTSSRVIAERLRVATGRTITVHAVWQFRKKIMKQETR